MLGDLLREVIFALQKHFSNSSSPIPRNILHPSSSINEISHTVEGTCYSIHFSTSISDRAFLILRDILKGMDDHYSGNSYESSISSWLPHIFSLNPVSRMHFNSADGVTLDTAQFADSLDGRPCSSDRIQYFELGISSTALHYAVKVGLTGIVTRLVSLSEAAVNSPDPLGFPPLWWGLREQKFRKCSSSEGFINPDLLSSTRTSADSGPSPAPKDEMYPSSPGASIGQDCEAIFAELLRGSEQFCLPPMQTHTSIQTEWDVIHGKCPESDILREIDAYCIDEHRFPFHLSASPHPSSDYYDSIYTVAAHVASPDVSSPGLDCDSEPQLRMEPYQESADTTLQSPATPTDDWNRLTPTTSIGDTSTACSVSTTAPEPTAGRPVSASPVARIRRSFSRPPSAPKVAPPSSTRTGHRVYRTDGPACDGIDRIWSDLRVCSQDESCGAIPSDSNVGQRPNAEVFAQAPMSPNSTHLATASDPSLSLYASIHASDSTLDMQRPSSPTQRHAAHGDATYGDEPHVFLQSAAHTSRNFYSMPDSSPFEVCASDSSTPTRLEYCYVADFPAEQALWRRSSLPCPRSSTAYSAGDPYRGIIPPPTSLTVSSDSWPSRECVMMLLKHKADVFSEVYGRTLLMEAIENGCDEAIPVLCQSLVEQAGVILQETE